MTVLEVLTAATEYLARHNVESPRLNAEYLLAHVLGHRKRIELYLEFERPLGEKERLPLRELVKRRGEGVPLQHLLGTVEFCGRVFRSDARALIPRPETEQLVELVLKLETAQGPRDVVDVGTGSGVIALSLAAGRSDWTVKAVDVSEEALALARENAEALGLAARVEFVQGDLLGPCVGPFDVIAANLPYVPTGDLAEVSREVRHDPVLALDGGVDGLDLVGRLAGQAQTRLRPGGLLALEIGHDQAARTREILAEYNYRDIAPHRDYQDIERFVTARHG